jgi:glycosyltransferase involved in cell wall biosynthesis
MFEYMALERSVVAVDRPALREILGEDAAYFRAGDPADFARVLCELAAAPEQRKRLAQGARMRASEYTYEKRAEKIIAACRAVA